MHNRVGWMAAGLCCSVVAGCGSANGDSGSRASGVDAALTSSAASCAGQSAAQDRAHAHLIFDATTLPGPSDPRSRTLLSPAHFTVSRYLKGHGPTVVRVQTAVTPGPRSGEYSYVEDNLQPRAGQRWLIYGQRTRRGVITASICSGSHQIGPRPTRSTLAGDGIAGVRFGASPAAVTVGLRRLLGRPGRPYRPGGACNYDHTIQWADLSANFRRSRFVGYSYGMYGTLGPPHAPRGALPLATVRGLQVGDTMVRGQRLYGGRFGFSQANGGTWGVPTPHGLIDGFTWGTPKHGGAAGSGGDVGPRSVVATIEAGAVGCPALSP